MLKLSVLDEICSICRLSPDEEIPTWAAGGIFIVLPALETSCRSCAKAGMSPQASGQNRGGAY